MINSLRPLGAFEHFFWLLDQNRPVHFALAAQVQGATEIEQWRNALDLVQRRHPLLSVCIEKNGNQPPYFRQNMEARIPLRVLQEKNAGDRLLFQMAIELSIPFDAARAPLVRAVLLHEDNQAVLILIAHHSIADGRSIAFVIRDLLNTLAGNPIGFLPLLPSHEVLLGLNGTQSVPTVPETKTTSLARPVAYIDKDDMLPRIRSLKLTPELTSQLRGHARKQGTTIHGALSAALALAAWQNQPHFQGIPIRICSPVDTRNLLGLGEDCAALIDAGIVTIERRKLADFWHIARESTAALAGAQTLQGVIASRNVIHQSVAAGMDVATAAAICADGFAHEIMLTNLGNLPFETEFGHLRLETIWGPAVSARFEGAPTIGVATVNGALCLLETSFSASESLLKATERILLAACEAELHFNSFPAYHLRDHEQPVSGQKS